MPIHLLGKKSWHVYNAANVERVQRDEAEAQERAETKELRENEVDARRRIALLRGEALPGPVSSAVESADEVSTWRTGSAEGHETHRKRRRLRGEDDTDIAIRHAREEANAGEKARQRSVKRKDHDNDAPLVDQAGHLQLISAPDEQAVGKAEKNAEAEAEKSKKRKREEDQYTMRFSNAAGFDTGLQKPWYAAAKSKAAEGSVLSDVQEKDVWGNADPLRRERDRRRMANNDPFALMQEAQQRLKDSENDKQQWKRKRAVELEELRAQERERRHKERKHPRRRYDEEDDVDSLDGFSLDAPTERYERERSDGDRQSRRHHHHQRRHHSNRSRSPGRDRRPKH